MNHHRHSDMERRLRERLTEAAEGIDAARPAALADDVFRRLRRSQQRTRFAAVAATLAAVAALVPGAVNRTSLAEPAAARGHGVVVSSYCADSGAAMDGSPGGTKPTSCFVLDPTTGQYVHIDGAAWPGTVTAAPDGATFLVQTPDPADPAYPGSFRYAVVSRADLLRGDTAAARWVKPGRYTAVTGWSPDGRTVLFAHRAQNATIELMLLNARTGQLTDLVALQGSRYYFGIPIWDPGGASFWYPVWNNSQVGYRLMNYDLAGRTTGRALDIPADALPEEVIQATPDQLRISGSLWGWWTARPPTPVFSPDLRYATCLRTTLRLCDLRTGTLHTPAVQALAAEVSGPQERRIIPMGWYDRRHLLVTELTSTGAAVGVVDIDGHVVDMTPLPVRAGHMVTFQVAPASKYPPGVGMRF